MAQSLLINLLKAVSHNRDIYPLLQPHVDTLNNKFALSLREFACQKFAKDPAKAVNIARVIVKFSNLIQKFEPGDAASKLEIAIAGYETALTVITREIPQEWGTIQQSLVNVYQQRQQILFTTITELRNNTIKTQTQINNLPVQFEQKLQQAKQQIDELKIGLSQLEMAENNLRSQHFNTVVLYDIENLTKGNMNPKFNFSLKEIFQKIKGYNLVNKITLQYAYADWSNSKFRQIKTEIRQLGIEPIQIFGFNNHSNAADIQLVID